jgi:hypothetical protein
MRLLAALLAVLVIVPVVGAQSEPPPVTPPAPVHPFWDSTNIGLFVGVGASRGLDYASTRHFRARGFQEVLLTNHIVDDKPLFVSIEVAGTALSIGISHFLHTHGHHRFERAVSIVHIGVTTFGVIRNYNLKKH